MVYNIKKMKRYPFSSFLIVLGLIIGLGGVFAALSTGGSVQNSMNNAFTEQNIANITFTVNEITPEIENSLATLSGVDHVESRIVYKTDLYYHNSWKRLLIVGIPDFNDIHINKFEQSPIVPPPQNALLLDSSVKELTIKEGEKITFYSPHGPISLEVFRYRRNPGYISYSYSGEAVGFCQISTAKNITGIENPNHILITVETIDDIDAICKTINKTLEEKGVSVIYFEKNTPKTYFIRNLVTQTQFLIIQFSFMLLLTACIFLWNSTTALFLEEKNEIKIMEKVGLTRVHRFLMYFPSKVFLILMAAGIGLPLGWVFHTYLTAYFCEILNIKAVLFFDYQILLITVILGIGLSTGFSVLSVGLGTKAGDISRFRFSYPFKTVLEKLKVPLSYNIAISSYIKHKARTTITILGLTFFLTLLIITQSTGSSIRYTLTEEIYGVRSYDLYVYFDTPIEITPELTSLLDSIEEIQHHEYWFVREGLLDEHSIQICGIPYDTGIYHPKMIEGTYFEPHMNGAMISTYLARQADIQVGEEITVELHAQSADFTITGIIADADHDGKTVFIPLEYFENVFDVQNERTHIMIDIVSESVESAEETGFFIKEKLLEMDFHGSIRTKNESIKKTENMTAMFLLLFYSFLGLVGVIAFISTSYALTFNVMNRKKEFQLLYRYGANLQEISRIILITTLLFCVPAWVISLLIGPYFSEIFVQFVSMNMLPIQFVFSQDSIFNSLFLGLLISALAAIYPILYMHLKISP
jgi:ABC-type lipoprotein release transport system permease subunit